VIASSIASIASVVEVIASIDSCPAEVMEAMEDMIRPRKAAQRFCAARSHSEPEHAPKKTWRLGTFPDATPYSRSPAASKV
jgi:hypothetical protein